MFTDILITYTPKTIDFKLKTNENPLDKRKTRPSAAIWEGQILKYYEAAPKY